MSLIADFQDQFGGPRVARFPDWATDYLVADLDLSGFDLLGLSLDDLSFAAQKVNTVYAGPASGAEAAPTFRLLEASEIGAQPHSEGLDTLSPLLPSTVGQNLLTLTPAVNSGYFKVFQVGDVLENQVSIVATEGVLADIGGMPLTYLSTDQSLGGGITFDSPGPSNAKVPSQLAVYEFVKARTGSGVKDDADDTKASQSIVDLDSVDGPLIQITGTTTINGFTLADGRYATLRFTGSLTLTDSATLQCPGGENIITQADGYANVVGKAGGVVLVLSYFEDQFQIHYGGDFYTGGTFYSKQDISFDDSTVTNGLNILYGADVDIHVPLDGVLANELGNYSIDVQTPPAATRTYIGGSKITIPASGLNNGTKFSWKFNITKTAAGSASSTFDVCVGTAGTTADTARLSFVKPAGTAASDEGFVTIEAVIGGPLSEAIFEGEMIVSHNLASTGHMTIPIACVHSSAAAFDATVANLLVGVCITSGAADAITINQVSSQVFNI